MTTRVVVWNWSRWTRYLLSYLVPAAQCLTARPQSSADNILSSLAHPPEIFLFHLDISLPPWFIEESELVKLSSALKAAGTVVLNGGIRCTLKSFVQSSCASAGLPIVRASEEGDPKELLLVKTNFNSGGNREKLFQKEFIECVPSETYPTCPLDGPRDYRIVTRSRIPPGWWCDESLAIERFIRNQRGRFFRLYKYRSAVVIAEGWSHRRIKRIHEASGVHHCLFWSGSEITGRKSHIRLPKRLVEVASVGICTFSLDFGAMDFVENDHGELFIVDVNHTPYWGQTGTGVTIRHLRNG
jgi:hypothetical protein